MSIKTLIVDDSMIFRSVVRSALRQIDDVELIGFAASGEEAVEKIRTLKPDLVTLDVEMPGLSGLEVLETIAKDTYKPAIVMLSSLTRSGAAATTKALARGAMDFILKPQQGNQTENLSQLLNKLSQVVASLQSRKQRARILSRGMPSRSDNSKSRVSGALKSKDASRGKVDGRGLKKEVRINPVSAICIGISTGGPAALNQLIPRIPADLSVPIFVVQHMPAMFTSTLAERLNAIAQVKVCEATNGMAAEPGNIYIAPGGRQMKVCGVATNCQIEINDDEPVQSCRPSVDYLLHSAAPIFGSRLLSIVMTGMGADGVDGCRAVERLGGMIWTQSEATCTVYGMPRAVEQAGLSQRVLALDQFSSEIRQAIARKAPEIHKPTPTAV